MLVQVKNFKTYVKREIVHQSSLKHPFIVSLKEVGDSSLLCHSNDAQTRSADVLTVDCNPQAN